MSRHDDNDLSAFSMRELFLLELEQQSGILTDGLLQLEQEPDAGPLIEDLMRAAHSLKGAARLVDLDRVVRLAHAIEDCFVAAREADSGITATQVDCLLHGVDLINRVAKSPVTGPDGTAKQESETQAYIASLRAQISPAPDPPEDVVNRQSVPDPATTSAAGSAPEHPTAAPVPTRPTAELSRDVRVAAETLNRLLGLAGESLAASQWLDTFASDLRHVRRVQQDLSRSLDGLRQALTALNAGASVNEQLMEAQTRDIQLRDVLAQRFEEVERLNRHFGRFSQRLYLQALDCRMRPFADGIQGFQRMARDLARSLGKEVKFEVVGESANVDRDVLARIEAPLSHLIRNAVDHGIEGPDERAAAGKEAAGSVRIAARHVAGVLFICVEDDGRGVDPNAIRQAVIDRKLADPQTATQLTEAELLEFLFLPGFTLRTEVTEVSGRGVGLDVVQTALRQVGGKAQVFSHPGRGMRFELQLPLSLSVIRGLLVEIADEPYAFPLGRVAGTARVSKDDIETVEGRQHFRYAGRSVGLVTAHQVLEIEREPVASENPAVVVLEHGTDRYGVVVDRFLGERELVVRELDPLVGKVKNISSAALTPNQTPVLIFDVDDLIRSLENLTTRSRLALLVTNGGTSAVDARKRVLVVDDSLTVRELVRKLIESRGYHVDMAVDGMDGWHAIRSGRYDLIITDVDMPRLDGVELVKRIRNDARLHALPVMIVSYKDREDDRQRGLDAGADYYLTKGSFHDDTLLQAVSDLIGDVAA